MINRLSLLSCLLLLQLSICAQGIKFDDKLSWSQIKEKAKAENKYIFVDAFATWCGPCKIMDEQIYPLEDIGKLMNDKFISVKVQFDQTEKDNEYVKSWYADAKRIGEQYRVTAFPSYLFFAPDGELVHSGMGIKPPPDFLQMANFAIDPKRKELYAMVDDYKKGKKDYPNMLGLIITIREVAKNVQLATEMAQDYKKNYLDKLPVDSVITREKVDFYATYFELLTEKDQFFKACYNNPKPLDSMRNIPGWAGSMVTSVLVRQQLDKKLVKDRKPVYKSPDWIKYTKRIKKRYPKVDVENMVLDYKMYYYQAIDKNWKIWADCQEIKISKDTSRANSFGTLNMPAWNVFLHCDDQEVLKRALGWSEKSLAGREPKEVIQQLDTRANLLYKLGRTQEAIEQETKALETSRAVAKELGRPKGPFEDTFKSTLEKMKKGEPTWPKE